MIPLLRHGGKTNDLLTMDCQHLLLKDYIKQEVRTISLKFDNRNFSHKHRYE